MYYLPLSLTLSLSLSRAKACSFFFFKYVCTKRRDKNRLRSDDVSVFGGKEVCFFLKKFRVYECKKP